ncbi:MAG: hypothetical protein AABY44_06755, partial [Nitrospirota bacterium]
MADYKLIAIVPIVFLLINLLPFSLQVAIGEEDPSFIRARERMVQHDLAGRDIKDKKVLEVMGRIPRHAFVSKDLAKKAY